jgi:hypothetical protein
MTWLKRYFADLFGAYADGVRVAAALPWLFALVAGWEFAQHVVEVRIGFFDSREASKAVSLDGSRMALGWVKMLLVYVGGFLAIRCLVGRDGGGPIDAAGPAAARYAPYVLYSLALFALIVFAGRIVAPARVDLFRALVGLAQLLIEPLLMLWVVSAVTDGAVAGPAASARRTGVAYFYALPLFFVARLPIGIAHNLLNKQAMGRPHALVWTMLAVDALVVGLLVAIIPAISVRVSRAIEEPGARSGATRVRVAPAA